MIIIGENVVLRFQMMEGESQVRTMQFAEVDADIPIKRLKLHITTEEINELPVLNQLISTLFEVIEKEGRTLAEEASAAQNPDSAPPPLSLLSPSPTENSLPTE